MSERCGRHKNGGGTCGWRKAPGMDTCRIHAKSTAGEETQRWQERKAERDARIPACWTWPIPPRPAVPTVVGHIEEYAEFVFDRLSEFHAGRCAMCGTTNRFGGVHDHCHRTGLLRGFLCHSCNVREGRGDSPWIDRYRKLPPAVIVGVSTEYAGRADAYVEPWVEVALGRVRPGDDDPVGQAGYLAEAAHLPHETQWYLWADKLGIDYERFGLQNRNRINAEITERADAALVAVDNRSDDGTAA